MTRLVPTLLCNRIFSQFRSEISALSMLKGSLHISTAPTYASNTHPVDLCSLRILTIPSRKSTIFTSLTSDVIWEGVTGPRGSTKKRARGKRRVTRPKIDLNRGQRIGGNKEGYLWPGLNAPLHEQSCLGTIKKVYIYPT